MNINKLIKKVLSEATSDSSGAKGGYSPPLQPGMREFDKNKLTPFTQTLNDFKSPLVAYDSYDKKFDLRRNQIQKLEKTARKITDYIKHHPYSTFTDEDGGIINPTPSGRIKKKPYGKEIVPIKENTTAVSSGEYTGPIELGLRKWKSQELKPFTEFVDTDINHEKKQKTMKNNIKRKVGVWEKNPDGSYKQDEHDVHTINEDLAVWFGTKKKPKGSKQPKGPWVDICRKVNGKHPPCGRKDTDSGAYPKCRAAGVAGKMSDSAKKSACQQKRRAEKKDTQTGKGQKPIMTSYKPRKKNTNENMKTIRITERELVNTIRKIINEESEMFNKNKKEQMVVDEVLWTRNMITSTFSDNTNVTKQKGYQVSYGYDNVGRKIVQAIKDPSMFGRVELNCNTGRIDFDSYAVNNKVYEKYQIKIDEQKQSDYEHLKPYCDAINWKYGDRIKKRK